jgi:P-type Mg2+ transporter
MPIVAISLNSRAANLGMRMQSWLKIFHATEALFHTGWFVESLATQTLVLFVIRTAGNPFRSRPSLPLAITTMLIVLLGIVLPVSPLAKVFGFTPLPAMFFLFLGGMVITYLFLVEMVKRRLMRRRRIHLRLSRLR